MYVTMSGHVQPVFLKKVLCGPISPKVVSSDTRHILAGLRVLALSLCLLAPVRTEPMRPGGPATFHPRAKCSLALPLASFLVVSPPTSMQYRTLSHTCLVLHLVLTCPIPSLQYSTGFTRCNTCNDLASHAIVPRGPPPQLAGALRNKASVQQMIINVSRSRISAFRAVHHM